MIINTMFKLELSPNEYRRFMAMLPLCELTADEFEKSKALEVIGVDNDVIYNLLAHHDPELVLAFRTVLFVMSLKDFPKELSSVISKIKFVDKYFERRFFKMLGRQFSSRVTLTANELNDMWKLKSAYDDGGVEI